MYKNNVIKEGYTLINKNFLKYESFKYIGTLHSSFRFRIHFSWWHLSGAECFDKSVVQKPL